MRDLELAAKVSRLSDDAWVGSEEVAALTGFSVTTIRQRKVALPPTDNRYTVMRWTMGAIREWMRAGTESSGPSRRKGKGGRPRKADSVKAINVFSG